MPRPEATSSTASNAERAAHSPRRLAPRGGGACGARVGSTLGPVAKTWPGVNTVGMGVIGLTGVRAADGCELPTRPGEEAGAYPGNGENAEPLMPGKEV